MRHWQKDALEEFVAGFIVWLLAGFMAR